MEYIELNLRKALSFVEDVLEEISNKLDQAEDNESTQAQQSFLELKKEGYNVLGIKILIKRLLNENIFEYENYIIYNLVKNEVETLKERYPNFVKEKYFLE